jgi:hypothetical protein
MNDDCQQTEPELKLLSSRVFHGAAVSIIPTDHPEAQRRLRETERRSSKAG